MEDGYLCRHQKMDRDDILRRVNDNILDQIMVSDLISEFSIIIQARDIHGKPLLSHQTRFTQDDIDITDFPIQEVFFKELWGALIKEVQETKASDL